MEAMVVCAADAATLLRMSDSQCLKMLDSGDLPGYRDGREWKIPKVLLERYVIERAEREAAERRRVHEEVQNQGE